MTQVEKYLPFALALLMPALSMFVNYFERFSSVGHTLLIIHYAQGIIFILVVWYLVRWMLFSQRSKGLLYRIAALFLLITIVLGTPALLPILYAQNIPGSDPYALSVFRTIIVTLLIIVLQYVFKYQRDRADLKMQNLSLQAENLKFQLETMKQQINPHFLFNSLNTLLDLVEGDNKDAAIQYIRNFSSLFRTVLQSAHHDMVPLKDELRFLRDYWSLLKVRFKEAIDLKVDIEPALKDYLIPPLSLQYLVENAIKHNEASPDKPLAIHIHNQKQALIVSNPVRLKKFPTPSARTGLKNLQQRIRLLTQKNIAYGEQNGHYKVEIPLMRR
jgi:sensor histidine kinase YesM